MSERRAPVQSTGSSTVPWDIHVRAWQVYAALGHRDQSAVRIAERGGFGWGELVCLLAERDPYGGSGGYSWKELRPHERAKLDRLRAEGAEK